MLDLMRRYVHGFVNSHDPAVAREIMAAGYQLHMGIDTLTGRDDAYIPAVMHQIAQFPALGFSIHDLVTDGTMTALLFSEHGRSAKQPGIGAAWRGVSIYRAENELLTECWVEQDHFGRRRQLATGISDVVGVVALDPWSGHHRVTAEEHAAGRAALEKWATELSVWPPKDARLDGGSAASIQPRLDVTAVQVHACVVEGDRLAFNATVSGRYQGGLPDFDRTGISVDLHIGAFASVRTDGLAQLEAVTNRVAVQRQLRSESPSIDPHSL